MENETFLNAPFSLEKKVQSLLGVGEKTAQALRKNQIVSIFDLLLHVPKSMVLESEAISFSHMEQGRFYRAKGRVAATKITGIRKLSRLEAILEDGSGRLMLVFFGPAVAYAQKLLKQNCEVTVLGEVKHFLGRPQMVHPKLISNVQESSSEPILNYSQIGGLNSATFKRIIDKALNEVKKYPNLDYIDNQFLDTYSMAPLKRALISVHEQAEEWDRREKHPSFRRLAFEELLSFYTRLKLKRNNTQQKPTISLSNHNKTASLGEFLPFTLTKAQHRVILEILNDLAKNTAMCRLLQGDVGSGKTAVSAVVAHHVVEASLQVAVMAPTEILAEQLFSVYKEFFNHTSIKLALLTASTKVKTKKAIYDDVASHKIDIVIGTHALLSNNIHFNNLGLLIIDEQHRFGVNQRAELLDTCAKHSGINPHLLVMSATPIPRSLALTLYGDLELSVIDEKPPGRIPVHTQVLNGPIIPTLLRLCERIIATSQKAFIVFPLIEESEHLDLEYANKALLVIQERFGASSAALLHGKMKSDEKTAVMTAFRDGKVSFLVATTVVEVGVDIKDATCMAVVHPERFGLAQLHQLRGRVGRKDLKSFCFLVTDLQNKFGTAQKRLNAMCQTDNGFKLAEIDLEIRGPGELLGVKQSGLPNFVIFSHSHFADLISPAKAYAAKLSQGKIIPAHLYQNKEAHFS